MSTEDQQTILPEKNTTANGLRPATRLWFARTVTLGSSGAAILALLGLLGYLPGLRIIGSLRSDYVPMAVSTAGCFLILAAALFLHARKPQPGFGLMLVEALVIFATAFGLLCVAGSFAGRDLNFEDMLFPETGALGKIHIGHMSPATGAVFIMAGLGTFLLLLAFSSSRHDRRFTTWAASLGVLTILAGATVMLSYLYGVPLMYSGSAVPMAATTAAAFLFLGAALVAKAGPESYPVLWVMGDSTAARLSRVFLPLTMSMVLLQGILSRFVTASTRINHALFLAALVIVAGTITSLLVVRVAHSIGGSLDEAEGALRESEERYREIFDTSPDAILLTAPDGRILAVNSSACRLFEQTEEEIKQKGRSGILDTSDPRLALALAERERTGKFNGELTFVRKSGLKFSGEISSIIFKDKKGRARTSMIIRDISERKQAEAYRDMGTEILHLLNMPGPLPVSIQRILASVKARTGFDAVGIRLREGDDFPYFVQDGFSTDFLLTENTLIERSTTGGVCRDKDGNISLECTCGLVISGKADPANPFFTPGGSFWTNDSFPLLELTPEQDPRRHPRNQCIHQGYASVALVPIRQKELIVGLLQLNDHRKGRFSLAVIEQLEGIAAHIGEALMRKQTEDEIQRQLAEKEMLLKEVHHRIKNNIASISGLLSLRLQSITNPEAVAALQEAIGRVNSIRLLYDKMLLSEGYKDISVKNYVESLTDAIVALFPGSANVTVEKRIADFHLDANQLFPLGLIINELLTNKMKYAFINRKTGLIKISLENAKNHITLIMQDNGVGLPDGFDVDKSKGFGLTLVKMLSQQLGGSFSIETRNGTRSKLEFII